MVYKVCKGGVRSGNTLRGLNTRNSYRYSRHACLIGKSSMSNRDVTKMVRKSTDDDMIAETVQSTDVILSLNKKQRWRLPSAMRHMIQTGYFGSSARVSMLERHKLKRRANCVSFVSNKGKTTFVQPKQKRYFSYNLNKVDEEQSNREKKRLKAQALVDQIKEQDPLKRNGNKAETIQAFTVVGPEPTADDCVKDISQNRQPEYRIEIFYPCPKTCSLTFNPKYTDVIIEENETGEQEVRAVKTQGQSKASRRHRKRLTTSAWTELSSDDVDDDVTQMWDDVYTDDCLSNAGEYATSTSEEIENRDNVYESMWSKLIDEAVKAKSLTSQKPYNTRKKYNHTATTSSLDPNFPNYHMVDIENFVLITHTQGDDNHIPEFTHLSL